MLAQVSKRNAPVEVYEYDEVTYDLKPSSKTLNDERAKLEKFLGRECQHKEFHGQCDQVGLFCSEHERVVFSAGNAPHGRNAELLSRQPPVVRWVMIDGKPGAVSHIYESKDAMTPRSLCSGSGQ